MTQPLKVILSASSQQQLDDLFRGLTALNHEVVSRAGDAADALRALKKNNTDLLIVERDPQNMEGPQLTRQAFQAKSLPVLVVRESADVAELIRASVLAGSAVVFQWMGDLGFLSVAIEHARENYRQKLKVAEMSEAARLIIETGRDITVKRERLSRSLALDRLRRESRLRNMALVN